MLWGNEAGIVDFSGFQSLDVSTDHRAIPAEGNTRPSWSHVCEYTCVHGWVARVG